MNRKQFDKLMRILISCSTVLILVGAFFGLEHYPYGDTILWIGIAASLILSDLEIRRLKGVIKDLEQKV